LIKYYAREGLCGTLVYSPPAMGKTTFLRSAAYLLAEGRNIRPYRVGIVDERCEIYIRGIADGLIDVVTNCPKAYAIELLCRTMSPEVIICDEIGSGEQDAVINAQNTGVHLIASAHGDSIAGLRRRPFINKMLEAGLFDTAVKLNADEDGFHCDIERITV
jgi:stage III sporulation protein AA